MTPQLNFIYLHSDQIGYGYHGSETHRALTEIGIEVYDGLPGSGDLDINKKRAKVCKDVLFLTTPTHVTGWYENQRPHLFTMWEGTELPELMRQALPHFETILTPSQHCVELYSRYHDNVHFVPLGVDGNRWHFQERRNDIFFNFLVAGSGLRKGADLVTRAFLELFAGKTFDGPIPRLLIKSPNGGDFSGENIEVISGWMPPEDEVALYASAHCFVAPSRGEGWGMQPLQAMAQGCPTILTDAHGHSAFACFAQGRIPAKLAPAGAMDMFGDAGMWWEPDFEHLKMAMLHVYENYAVHRLAAEVESVEVRRRFTWRNSARAIVDALGADKLTERFRFPDLPTKWTEPDARKFRVVTNRNWRADIAGVTHLFEQGKEYEVQADVKRVLFQAQVLDPCCEHNGLTPSQIQRWKVYKAEQLEEVGA